MRDKSNKLTPKQSAFVAEYLIDLNGTQAAVRAGYSPRTANEQAARLLAKDSVKEAVAEAKAKRAEECARTALDVLKDIQADTRLARAQGDLKTSLRGLELEGKHLGMFVERRELSGPNGGPIATRPVSAFYGEDDEPEGK